MRYFLGVDPGKEGGVAMVDAEGALLWTKPTPLVPGKGAGDYNVEAIVELVELAIAEADRMISACVELLLPLPPAFRMGAGAAARGGSAANFARGLSHGWTWILTAYRVPLFRPRPQAWQGRMLEPGPAGTTKERSIAAAVARWPAHDFRRTPRSKGPHDGLADAANLADYGRIMTAAEGLTEHETRRLFAGRKGKA